VTIFFAARAQNVPNFNFRSQIWWTAICCAVESFPVRFITHNRYCPASIHASISYMPSPGLRDIQLDCCWIRTRSDPIQSVCVCWFNVLQNHEF